MHINNWYLIGLHDSLDGHEASAIVCPLELSMLQESVSIHVTLKLLSRDKEIVMSLYLTRSRVATCICGWIGYLHVYKSTTTLSNKCHNYNHKGIILLSMRTTSVVGYSRETTVEKEAGLEFISSRMRVLLPIRGAPMSTIGLYGL